MESVTIENQKLVPFNRPEPEIADPHAVKIKVAAIGINRADLFLKQGNYKLPTGSPDFPGLEISGEVVEMGSSVRKVKRGDKVVALTLGGAYAEYVVVSEAMVMEAPRGVSLEEAAALPEAMATVYLNLFLLGKLKMGERVLIHGGTSGIGIIGIQMARAMGAEVFVTCGSAEKCRIAETLGAKAINYKQEDFGTLKDIDIVLDIIGAPYLEKNLSVLGYGGRLLMIALIGGAKAEIPLNKLFVKNLSMQGSTLSSRPLQERYQILEALREFWWPRVASGEIKPLIDSRWPLSKAEEAHQRMEHYSHAGKILLIPGASR